MELLLRASFCRSTPQLLTFKNCSNSYQGLTKSSKEYEEMTQRAENFSSDAVLTRALVNVINPFPLSVPIWHRLVKRSNLIF